MEINEPLFDSPLQVISDKGDCVWLSMLDQNSARRHAAALVEIHNLIPFVRWTRNDILSNQIGQRVFHHKWHLSVLITCERGDPIGFLVSYLRLPDSNFDCVSVYMHRMAILAALQRRGIGRQIISMYLHQVFIKIPVDYVTLQANDTVENARIIGLYEALGFTKIKKVFYPEKTDWLMACPRIIGKSFPVHIAK